MIASNGSLSRIWSTLGLWLAAFSATSAVPALAVDYLTDIKPLLSAKCYSCHGVLKQEADLRLETRALMMQGGDGAVIVPGAAARSLLFQRVTADEEERMPPAAAGAALRPEELALLRSWIDAGAHAPEEAVPEAPEQHWAFREIVRPALPVGQNGRERAADSNPIDLFLEAKRRKLGLTVQPRAPRPLALRRLYLDLIGLPPASEQLQDDRPWEVIVDELLNSPQHGERWGRHWMDVWRYSDWYGLGAQLRYSQKHLWHWRDWIVESLNEDKGYDRMIVEMLAGDEVAPQDLDVLRATGFLARNYYLFNRTTWLDSTIEHTSKAFLGLTLNCAKCHDHKYDPITQADYYRFRALFEPHQVRLDPLPGVTDFEQDGLPRVFDDHLDLKTYLHVKGDPAKPDKQREMAPGVPAFLSSFAAEIEPVSLSPWSFAPDTREYVQEDRLAAAQRDIAAAEKALLSARQHIAKKAADEVVPGATAAAESLTLVEDDFSRANPERWELVGEGWRYQDGCLLQTMSTRERHFARLRQPHPRNFELTCRFTTTGGATYKSVTFRFDQTDNADYDNFVYTSAHAPGPKVQIAYTRDGKQVYPADGTVARPIEVGKAYEIRFAVRDRLVNVWLDKDLLLAFVLPDRRPNGHLSLSGFDATVAFDSLTLRRLGADTVLVEPSAVAASALPENAVEIAAARLRAAQARFAALEAIIAAEDLRYAGNHDEAEVSAAVLQAAQREAASLQAAAEYEQLLGIGDEGKRKAAQAKRQKAAALLKQVAFGKAEYTPFRASRKALETPEHNESTYGPTYPQQSSGRRLALARWITDSRNPLTARVAVNHVWLRHFGEPLVESVFDFGLRTARPEQAELLDYLAAEFMESGWSFRKLHRLMVTSQAYQLSTTTIDAAAENLAADPTNRYYWRMNTRRMESEVVRDSLLHLAAALDTTRGGPSVAPGTSSRRRSIYFKHSRDDQDLFLAMFDDADHLQCYRRSESIVPQQALALANSELSLEMSERIARQLVREDPQMDIDTFIETTFFALLARQPDEAEMRNCRRFCQVMAELQPSAAASDRTSRTRARLVHALLNHSDFISIR